MLSISFAISALLFSVYGLIYGFVESSGLYFFLLPSFMLCFSAAILVKSLIKRKKEHLSLGVLLILAAITLFSYSLYALLSSETDMEELYRESVSDSVFAEADEIFPLVAIEADSPFVTWSADEDKVLMLSWNDTPEEYLEGTEIVVKGEIWTFTDREIASWYSDNKKGVKDWDLRLKQLIGLPPESSYTHVTAFWCDPEELFRPCYETDITKQLDVNLLDGSALGDYESWFDGNTLWSYFDSAYPWTRLGYTYDWAEGGSEYGLSELIIRD